MTYSTNSDELEWSKIYDLSEWIDRNPDPIYSDEHGPTITQTWARVAKMAEEVGEAVAALIGYTGQNPRKGRHGSIDDVAREVCDVALTAMCALAHLQTEYRELAGDAPTRLAQHINKVHARMAIDSAS